MSQAATQHRQRRLYTRRLRRHTHRVVHVVPLQTQQIPRMMYR